MLKSGIILFISAMAMPVFAETGWERLLVPIVTGDAAHPGGHGSSWVAKLTVFNSSGLRVPLTEWPDSYPCKLASCAREHVDPHETADFSNLSPAINGGGVFLYTISSFADELHASLRVFDASRALETLGTQIPVIRRSEVQSGSDVHLVGIPVSAEYRSLLRIYDLEALDRTQVEVRVFDRDGVLLRSETVELRTWADDEPAVESPRFPAYGQLYLTETFTGTDSSRIEITGSDEQRLWAFVTVTNNETQLVTSIVPD